MPQLHSPLAHVLPVGHGVGWAPHLHASPAHVSAVSLHGSAVPHLQAPAVQRSTFAAVQAGLPPPPHEQLAPSHWSAVMLEQPPAQTAPLVWAQLGKVPWTTQRPVVGSQQPPPESAAHFAPSHSHTSGSGVVAHTWSASAQSGSEPQRHSPDVAPQALASEVLQDQQLAPPVPHWGKVGLETQCPASQQPDEQWPPTPQVHEPGLPVHAWSAAHASPVPQ